MAAPKPALNRLEETLNNVFLHFGSVFNDPSNKHPLNMTYHRMRLEKEIPRALENWHDAFDDLENEIVRARAILRRDVAIHQAEKQKIASSASTAATRKETEETADKEEKKDIVMTDMPAAAAADEAAKIPQHKESTSPKPETFISNSAPAMTKSESADGTSQPEKPTSSTSTPTGAPPEPIAQAQSTSAPTSAPTQLATQDQTNAATSQHTESAPFEHKDTPPASQTPPDTDPVGIDALLPGLEQYANVGASVQAEDQLDDSSKPADDLGVQDGSFEDLFDWGNFGDGNEDGGVSLQDEGGKSGNAGTGFDDMKFDADFFNLE